MDETNESTAVESPESSTTTIEADPTAESGADDVVSAVDLSYDEDDQGEVLLLEPPLTGDEVVDGITSTVLDGLSGPLEGHAAVLETAHRALQEHLAAAETADQ